MKIYYEVISLTFERLGIYMSVYIIFGQKEKKENFHPLSSSLLLYI